MAAASAGLIASLMWWKSTLRTSSSVGISASSRHSGTPASLARRSQTALTSAPVAMWMTPFSGPSHRSCTSAVSDRQNVTGEAEISAMVRPTTWWARARTAAQVISLPRPLVKVNPAPKVPSGASVRSST
jgi:hypothetical protein